MPSPEVQIDKAAVANINAAIAALQDYTGRSVDQSLIYAALRLCISGRARAKIGKRKRDVIKNPEWEQIKAELRGLKGAGDESQEARRLVRMRSRELRRRFENLSPKLIVMRFQQQDPKYIPYWGTFDKDDKHLVIEDFPQGKRGLAKGLFNVAVGKLGELKGLERRDGRLWSHSMTRAYKYRAKFGDAHEVALRMKNDLSYLEKAFPGIINDMLVNGHASLVHAVKRKLEARRAA